MMEQQKTIKIFKILERIWLVIGVIGIACFIYAIINKDRSQAIYFIAVTVVSGIFYMLRKRQRVNAEKTLEQNK